MMNVGLHHRGVDPQLAAVLHAELHGSPHDELIDGLERRRRQPIEGIMLGHILAVKIGELAQRYSIGDAFAQLAIMPVSSASERVRATPVPR